MTDERLGELRDLLWQRAEVYDAEGESQEWVRLGKEIDALKAREGVGVGIKSSN